MSEHSPQDLVVDDVSRRFDRRWAVARVSFQLSAGSKLMVTGANGSGKTTLLRCLATAIRPHAGCIRFGGQDTWPQRDQLRHHIAYFSHAPRLYDDLNARDNLNVWAQLGGHSIDTATLLTKVGLPEDRNEPVRTFSAGMRRRLAFARILMQQSGIILLDEPFSALDPDGRTQLISLLNAHCTPDTLLIVATHMPQVCATLCPTSIHMEAGQVIWRGKSSDNPLIGTRA